MKRYEPNFNPDDVPDNEAFLFSVVIFMASQLLIASNDAGDDGGLTEKRVSSIVDTALNIIHEALGFPHEFIEKNFEFATQVYMVLKELQDMGINLSDITGHSYGSTGDVMRALGLLNDDDDKQNPFATFIGGLDL